MSQVINQETAQSEEFYKREVNRMLAAIQHSNEKMERSQEEIDWLKQQSSESLRRIDQNLRQIEEFLQNVE